jgi:hypothetical protein
MDPQRLLLQQKAVDPGRAMLLLAERSGGCSLLLALGSPQASQAAGANA